MGWNLFFDLACTLLLSPAFVWWMGDARPIARVTADCSCKVCDCSGPCPCPEGAVTPPNRATMAVQCTEAACPAAQPACGMPAKTAPTACSAPANEPVYQVQVRLIGDSAGSRLGVCCPMVSLPPNTYSLVSMSDHKGQSARSVHLQVKPVDACSVRLNMKLSLPGKKGEAVKRMACTRVVPLNKVIGLVLEGDCPEPCVAEVRVNALQGVPVMPAQPAFPPACPAPRVPNFRVAQPLPVPPPPPCVMPNSAPTTVVAFPTPFATTPPRPPQPTVPVVMPEPLPTPTLIPPPVPTPEIRLVNASAASRATSVSLFAPEGKKSQLRWKDADGSVSYCVRLEREMGASSNLTFAAGKKYVHVHGVSWQATAEKVEVHNDGFLVMTGRVKVVCEKGGKKSTLSADRVAMKVRSGKIDKVLGGMTLPR